MSDSDVHQEGRLEGQVAIVAGGGRAIGRMYAKWLTRARGTDPAEGAAHAPATDVGSCAAPMELGQTLFSVAVRRQANGNRTG
jgi:NAD(P)-dependent dehydrogenase (short-subunit alcohol dehydrogenase family)